MAWMSTRAFYRSCKDEICKGARWLQGEETALPPPPADDLNMPKLDAYETAMPISLIRQHLGWGHWFDRQKLTMKAVTGTQ